MRKQKAESRKKRSLTGFLLSHFCFLFLAWSAQAQIPTHTVGTFTNVPTVITTAGVSNVNSQVLLVQDRGIAILPHFAGTNAGTANLRFTFELSADGTNWTTTTPLSFNVPMNGSTGVRFYTNFTSSQLGNVKWLRLAQITNAHTESLFVTNVTWSIRGP